MFNALVCYVFHKREHHALWNKVSKWLCKDCERHGISVLFHPANNVRSDD